MSRPVLKPYQKRPVESGIVYPDSITGMQTWMRADSIEEIDNDPVSVWNDDFGNDHFTQGTGANQPTFKLNQLNGLPAVNFDGTDDYMDGGRQGIVMGTIAVVIRSTENPFTAYRGIYGSNDAGDENGVIADGSADSTSLFSTVFGGGVYIDGSLTDSEDLVTPDEWHIAISVDNTPLSLADVARIGQDRTQAGRFWYGDIAEILVFDTALNAANRLIINTYLNNKYKIY